MPQHFGVQTHLVAERVIHRRDVGARAAADFPNRRGAIAALGKNVPGRLDQLVARQIRGVPRRCAGGAEENCCYSAMSHIKHMFKTYV